MIKTIVVTVHGNVQANRNESLDYENALEGKT